MAKSPHRWKLHRVGGLEQVSLDTTDALESLGQLDQKLWVALSCPARGLELDPRTLENPISLRLAFFAPFKKLIRLIEDRASARRRLLFWAALVLVAAGLAAARWYHVWPFAP